MSVRLFSKFIMASIVYFVIGTLWMATHTHLPEPTQTLAAEIYNSSWIHLLVVGWLTLMAIGAVYYLVPTALNEKLFSERLGNIHFWVTNIAMVIGLVLWNVLAYTIDPFLAANQPVPQAMAHAMPLPLLVDLTNYVGWAAQLLFAYNIARTFARK